jgi:hypothetical protein
MASDDSIAAILKDYVPRSEHEQVLDALSSLDEENGQLKGQLARFEGVDPDKLNGRIKDLEGKVRGRNYQDAWESVAEKLGIDDDFRDDVFESLKLPNDKDEPDAKALEKHAREWLDAKESRKKYLKPAEEGDAPAGGTTPQAGDKGRPADRPRLHAEDEAGRGGAVAGGKMFRYRSENLSDAEWMKHNAVEYARAAAEGRLQKIG